MVYWGVPIGPMEPIMRVVITDPVRETINREVGDFDKEWAKIGQMVKLHLSTGDSRLTWCNIGVTHDADCIARATMHRTIAVLGS